MDNLDSIINSLKETIKLTNLKVSDDKILEQAVDIFISDRINSSKNGFIKKETFNRFGREVLKGEEKTDSTKPTEKQIKFLNKNKIKVPNTRKEATNLIREKIEKEIKKREEE